jgi:hypothetical protein
MKTEKKYSYYGLKVSSFFDFPELKKDEFDIPDVLVRFGEVDSCYSETRCVPGLYVVSESCCIFKLNPALLIQVTNGNTITICLCQNSDDDLTFLESYLLGPVFNVLLHQQEILLFHASVVSETRSCFAVIGRSGDGKSTTAAALCKTKRFQLVADDVCALSFSDDVNYRILSSAPRLRLLGDAFAKLGIDKTVLKENCDDLTKTSYPQESAEGEGFTRLESVFVLRPNKRNLLSVEMVMGIEKAKALLENMIWNEYLGWLGKREKLFEKCLKIANQTGVYWLRFDKEIHPPHLVSQAIKDTIDTDRKMAQSRFR